MNVSNFTEHMLFYASEKYPEEDSYSKYIAEVCLISSG
jgi:insulysin